MRPSIPKPQLGVKNGLQREVALQEAHDALEEKEDVDVAWGVFGARRVARFASGTSGACDGIAYGARDDGCYLIQQEGEGLKLAGLHKNRKLGTAVNEQRLNRGAKTFGSQIERQRERGA
jgi:hypothetical protein